MDELTGWQIFGSAYLALGTLSFVFVTSEFLSKKNTRMRWVDFVTIMILASLILGWPLVFVFALNNAFKKVRNL